MNKMKSYRIIIYVLVAMIVSYLFSGTLTKGFMRGIYWGIGGFSGFAMLYKLDPLKNKNG